jgi:hypothetical protein
LWVIFNSKIQNFICIRQDLTQTVKTVHYFSGLFNDVIDTEFTALNVTKVSEFCFGN